MTASLAGRLVLVPWHLGNLRDLTLRAIAEVKRIRVLAVEDPELSRRDLDALSIGTAGKEFWRLAEERDAALARRLLTALESEDVGLISSGGAPCFLDPGSWLVGEVRARGGTVVALPGASVLTLALSLGGEALHHGAGRATIVFPLAGQDGALDPRPLAEAAAREEAVYLLPNAERLAECLEILAGAAAERRLTLFFDLTKTGVSRHPLADQTRTMPCGEWARLRAEVAAWRFADVVLLLHPPAGRAPGGGP